MPKFLVKLSDPGIRKIVVPLLAAGSALVFLVSSGLLWLGGGPQSAAPPPLAVTTTVVPTTAVVTTAIGRRAFEGFSTIALTSTPAGADPRNYCALLADNNVQRAAGLMRQNDLGGFDAMVFRFPQDTANAFYMANVTFPLSVAWFGADGKLISTADMEPCKVQANRCPLYRAGAPYRFAVEVAKGGLGALGITAGSSIALGSPCS